MYHACAASAAMVVRPPAGIILPGCMEDAALTNSHDDATANQSPDCLLREVEVAADDQECGRVQAEETTSSALAKSGAKPQDNQRRVFRCKQCDKTYAMEFSLTMHMCIAHQAKSATSLLSLLSSNDKAANAGSKVHEQQRASATGAEESCIHALLKRNEAWRPKMKHVIKTKATAIWGNGSAGYIACGVGSCITVRDIDSMKIRHSFSCDAAVHAISGSFDGRILVYGLRSGEVVMRDMHRQGQLEKSMPKRNGIEQLCPCVRVCVHACICSYAQQI